jgi:hypothetical protein
MKRLTIAAAGLALVVAFFVAHGSLVRAQPVASIALPDPGTTKQLYEGCNNIALSFDDGTASDTVVQAVTPTEAVQSMWHHDAALNHWEGFAPGAPGASDLLTVDFMDAVWICVAGAAAAPTATPTPETTTPPSGGEFSRIIFLHHSCGANLIEQGGLRQLLTDLGYEFYDHGYNEDGLVLADGTWTGTNFDVPDDNTDPDGYANIFAQPLDDPPDNTFSYLMQYDVIAFKSCFPVSNIGSDEQLAEYKTYYLSIRDRMDEYPEKIFIVVTEPPEIAADTDSAAAARARAFTDWLASDEYLSGHANVFTFNFFDLLADPSTNMLRTEYQTDEYDAHPNELANQTIAPQFADFIDQSVRAYTGR